MATISSLVERDELVRIDPQLEPNEQEHRLVYALPTVIPRLSDELPSWTSIWQVEQDPIQQFDALLEVFCSGETLIFDRRFKPLNHLGEGVWELKTADLRLFGWFPVKDIFMLTCIDTATKVKTYNLYPGYAGEVVRQRNALPLNDPKFVVGEDPRDVVSNYAFP
jgi:hypothetical protein